jgi:hypothetical protein
MVRADIDRTPLGGAAPVRATVTAITWIARIAGSSLGRRRQDSAGLQRPRRGAPASAYDGVPHRIVSSVKSAWLLTSANRQTISALGPAD